MFVVVNVFGIILNLAASVLLCLKFFDDTKTTEILYFLGVTVLIITCLFLVDAYIRFAKVSPKEQIVEKKTVVLNSIAFSLFALG